MEHKKWKFYPAAERAFEVMVSFKACSFYDDSFEEMLYSDFFIHGLHADLQMLKVGPLENPKVSIGERIQLGLSPIVPGKNTNLDKHT